MTRRPLRRAAVRFGVHRRASTVLTVPLSGRPAVVTAPDPGLGALLARTVEWRNATAHKLDNTVEA